MSSVTGGAEADAETEADDYEDNEELEMEELDVDPDVKLELKLALESGERDNINGEELDDDEMDELVEMVRTGDRNALAAAREAVRGGGEPAKHFGERGGLKALLLHIGNSPTHTSPSLLSALADCSLEPTCRRILYGMNFEPRMVALLRQCRRDMVASTTCRILANLSRDSRNARLIISEGAVPVLAGMLGDVKTGLPALTMAVRAIRLLWIVDYRREDMISDGVVRSVAILLCAECLDANLITNDGKPKFDIKEEVFRKRSNLFSEILKCMGYFSTLPSFQCTQQMTGDGWGYNCLIRLTDKFETNALQCVLNLCYVADCRPLLGAAGAVECIINILKLKPDRPFTLVKGLSLLCRESVNRLKVQDFGGLSLLLNIVQDTTHLRRHLCALQALLLYIFDNSALKYMASEGLIEILTRLLTNYVATLKSEHMVADQNNDESVLPTIVAKNELIDRADPNFQDNRCSQCFLIHTKTEKCFNYDNMSPKKKPKYENQSSSSRPEPTVLLLKTSSPTQSPRRELNSPGTGLTRAEMRKFKSHRSAYVNYSADYNCSSYYYNNRSPESTSSSYDGNNYGYSNPSSPKYSGICYSPSSISQYDDDSSDSELSGHYSPVCSDVENEEAQTTVELECLSDTNDISNDVEDFILDGVVKKTQKLEIDDMSLKQIHSHRIRCLLLLLYQFSRYPMKTIKLTPRNLLYGLVHYIQKCKYPTKNMAYKTLSKIIGNPLNFENLILHSVILTMCNTYQNPKHSKCRQCKQLQQVFGKLIVQVSTIAESEYGFGHISNQLLNGDTSIKEPLALSLPYIIKSPRYVKKLYVNCNALELFLNILDTYKQPLVYSVPALSQLALNLKIRPPRPIFGKFKSSTYIEYDPKYTDGTETTFVLDDSTTVQADLDLLCQNSDFFEAMLHGSFKEGGQKRIRLQEVSKASLEYIIVLLQYGVHLKPVESFPLPMTIATALETLLIADRFLLERIKDLLFSAIIQFKLDSTTADKIYIWSLKDGMGNLCMEAVAYTLVGHMSNEKRCRIISAIMNSDFKDQWIEHLRYSLMRFME